MIRKSSNILLITGLALAIATALPALGRQGAPPQEPAPGEARSKDPVCNMMVRHDPDLSAEHQGKVYYFCMKRDLEAFEKDPDKYLEVEGQPHQHPDPGVAG